MERAGIKEEIEKLDWLQLTLLYSSLVISRFPKGDKRGYAVDDLIGIVEKVSEERGIGLPRGEEADDIALEYRVDLGELLKRYLGVGWEELVKLYEDS